MGIHGIFKEIGPGQRISLAKLASDHYVAHDRPLRLAIDISIWLFQIQAGKGGSSPALRTFYYRLLRLLTHNIHPLFVFDGPNKPLFKRNKKVGGPGVRVASVPEFLAKQLLKQFGFPWHVAPGEAEAECALLQRERVVDAVFSEDVDTLMFGSAVTLKNWSAENTSKTPTHINVYRAEETKEKSGLDREGMILVALMSGGDYITEGIPGCGPKFACDAARAGFGKDLCALGKRDPEGLKAWRARLQHQIRTNEDKIFSRRNTKLTIPDDFPNQEVFGYYVQPCVSTAEKVAKLRESLKWDQEIDFSALRSFTADAFDWRCLGGAKKFIRNLAPAMLIRQMRISSKLQPHSSQEAQEEHEKGFIHAIHGTRNHKTVDQELEYRISFTPMNLVSIDLSIEDEDDDFIPTGGVEEQSEAESEFAMLPSSTADENEPTSPTKKRAFKPYNPDQPEKLWIVHSYLKAGCPLLVEDYEASFRDPKAFLKQRRKARDVTSGGDSSQSKKPARKKKGPGVQQNALLAHFSVTKSSQVSADDMSSTQKEREPLKAISTGPNTKARKVKAPASQDIDDVVAEVSGFKLPSTQVPLNLQREVDDAFEDDDETPKASRHIPLPEAHIRPLAAFAKKKTTQPDPQKTPKRRRRPAPDVASPALSQKSILSWLSPSSAKPNKPSAEIINLISSSPAKMDPPRASSPSPPQTRTRYHHDLDLGVQESAEFSPGKLPDTVTKRRKKAPLKRYQTAPPVGNDEAAPPLASPSFRPSTPDLAETDTVDAMDLASPLTGRTDKDLPEISTFIGPIRMPSLTQEQPSGLPRSRKDSILPTSTAHIPTTKPTTTRPTTSRASSSTSHSLPLRRSPRQVTKKKRIELRQSLVGAWKEVEIEQIDLSGDGSGWKESGGRAKLPSWRKSGIEVLDLTGA